MFVFKYSFDCPLCSNKYFSNDAVLANSEPEAVDEALKKHRRCPFCEQSLAGRTVKLILFLQAR